MDGIYSQPTNQFRSNITEIEPTKKELVYDLVKEAGVDVSDWGSVLARAKTNPKYCYEWVFFEPGKVVVLNLWHRDMRETDHGIVCEGNYLADAANPAAAGAKPMWKKRALRVDAALKRALQENLEIRVIINSGVQRTRSGGDLMASQVKLRELDRVPWTITKYDAATGAFSLARGSNCCIEDQFSLGILHPEIPVQIEIHGLAFKRDAAVRLGALVRSNGRCEYCGGPGFVMTNGSLYLETHHIVPLSEKGPDHPTNVIALCPTHHREAHYGAERENLRVRFQHIMAGRPQMES